MIAPELTSERLVLRPLESSFLSEEYLSWLNDEETRRYLDTPAGQTLNDLKHFLEATERNPILFWAITLKENGRHIGNIKIDPVDHRHKRAEYGILLGAKDLWGKGLASEASQIVCEYCFQSLGLHKITLGVVEDNQAAVQLYQKMGFIIEGHYKHHGFYAGKWCDVLRMALFNPTHQS